MIALRPEQRPRPDQYLNHSQTKTRTKPRPDPRTKPRPYPKITGRIIKLLKSKDKDKEKDKKFTCNITGAQNATRQSQENQ